MRRNYVGAKAIGALAMLAALGLSSGQGTAAATTQGAEPEIAALVAEAIERNPDLAAARERAGAARERVVPAGVLPDPTLSIGYENDGWRPSLGDMQMTRLSIMASQGIPFPGKLGLREEIVERQAEEVAFATDRRLLGVEADVVRAYADLLLARKILEVIDDQERVWNETGEIVRTRYAVGQGAQQDFIRIQVEITRIGSEHAFSRADEAAALAALNRLRDRPPDSPVETQGTLACGLTVPTLDEFLARAYEESPEARAAESARKQAENRVDLARLDFYPDFAVSAGYMNRGDIDPMWQVGLGVTLPVWAGRKQAGLLAEAQASVRAAEKELAGVKLLLRERSEERIARLEAALTTAEIFEKGILPQDEMSFEAALANYRAGRVPFVTVLEAVSSYYNDRIEHLKVLADTRRIRARLEELDLGGGAMATPPMAGRGPAAPAMATQPMPSGGAGM